MPLFIVTGASGAGKSAVALALPEQLPEYVTLEMDILWRPEFDRPDDDYREFHETWLRVAKNVGQSGRPVVLCGTAAPGQLDRGAEAASPMSLLDTTHGDLAETAERIVTWVRGCARERNSVP